MKNLPNRRKVLLLSDLPVKDQLQLKDRALEATAEGITISDNLQTDNPIIYANEGFERLTGYTREDVLGKNCRFLQGEKSDPATVEEIRKSIREERPCSVEILNYHKDGSTFWNWLSITPIRDRSGRVTNFIGIQSDITKRKNYEQALYRISAKLEQANQQMKKDLEDARQLQLAMLPTDLPKLPHLEIAVKMQTAQEVGGDYYDFYLQDDKLTFALGDATGHGLKAGTIVTATKVLFSSFARLDDPKKILSKMSQSIKEIGLRNMYMAMLIAKITGKTMQISSAGIPFTCLYRQSSQTVSDIPLKGMPLGSFPEFAYQSEIIDLHKGDTLLFHSDGLSECFNQKGEMFGESRIKSLFAKIARLTPVKIIEQLTAATAEWMDGATLHDDMTLVVMKMRDKN
jgi:sigma-B regulation protein RsbU (phosphoserine phosphatase)